MSLDPLEKDVDEPPLEQVHEHFPYEMDSFFRVCESRLVQAAQTVREGNFAMKLSEHVRSTHNQEGAVVLDILHGEMFRLNLVASRMLQLLEQGGTESEITERVSQEFGVDRQIVASHCSEFLAHLEKCHLLSPARIPSTR